MANVIVTGASRGIGAAIARDLAARGHTVFAGTRERTPRVDPSAPGGVRPLTLDVTDAGQIERAVGRVLAEVGTIDAVVNNAGVAWFAPAEEMSEHVLRTTFETNFFGAVRCTQAVLGPMREQGHGVVIMMSSLAAATGLPLESAYCASKSALEAFAESTREEVARFGVRVAVVEPGVTEGGLATSTPDPEAPAESVYAALLAHTFEFYEQTQAESVRLVTDAVADLVAGESRAFRVRLGVLAPMFDEMFGSNRAESEAMLREALGINWWSAGRDRPESSEGEG